MNLIIRAIRFAAEAHGDQKRKFTGRPYCEHTERVAMRVARHENSTENMVCAAALHDVPEDTKVTLHDLAWDFPGEVVDMVKSLTNPSKQYPNLTRAEKKGMDRDHLRTCSTAVRLIKMADRVDNLNDAWMNGGEINWLTQYAKESYALLTRISIPGDPLTQEFRDVLETIRQVNELTDEQLKELA